LYNLDDYHKIQEPHDQFQSIQYSKFFHNNNIDNYYVQEPCDYDLDALPPDSNNEEVYNEAVDLCEISDIEFKDNPFF
ncbi:6239_t:CDS:2, partial [Gigaspora margarita]